MTNLTLITTIALTAALSAAGAAYYVKTEISQEPAATPIPVSAAQPVTSAPAPEQPVHLANAPPAPQKVMVETRIIEKEHKGRNRHDYVAEGKKARARTQPNLSLY